MRVLELGSCGKNQKIGGKARNLQFLLGLNGRVPNTLVIPWDAYEAYRNDKTRALRELEVALSEHMEPNRSYAVRSSANIEDSQTHSFAGQFVSVLDVLGVKAAVEAVQEVWDSADSDTVEAYAARNGISTADLKMAVLIQEMVTPVVSGVAFSKNPVTGMDEVVMEAVPGSGEALVQDGVQPWRWVFKWGTLTQETDAGIDERIVPAVTRGAQRIAESYGRPVDLEWVFDGEYLYWVQLRPITATPSMNVYSNRIAREVLPGIIRPLVWSINVPLVNGAWIRLLTEVIGRNDLKVDELAKPFYCRAYFNMTAMGEVFEAFGMPRESLELLMGLEGGDEKPPMRPSLKAVRHLPRIIRFLFSKGRYHRKIDALLPEMRATYARIEAEPPEAFSDDELLARVDSLFAFNQKAAYANIVAPLLMQAYGALLGGRLKRAGVDSPHFDVTAGLDGLDDYDPTPHLEKLHGQFLNLEPAVQAAIREEGYKALCTTAGAESLTEGVDTFIKRFGHLSDSGNDFSKSPWREQPDLVVRLVTEFTASRPGEGRITWDDLSLRGMRRRMCERAYKKARKYRLCREAVSFTYTHGYGLFRPYFLEMGRRLVERGMLDELGDVFYLKWPELRGLFGSDGDGEDPRPLVQARKQEIDAVRDVVLPDLILGEEAPPLPRAGEDVTQLRGIPTSGGRHRGAVRVIQSVEEFHRMTPGAVVVIPFSDVSWTPLIASASAVVAESGGTLSHSSIVAREYNLPAVVSVTNACRVLKDGMEVTVDGFGGEVTIHGAPDQDTPVQGEAAP